MRVRLLLAAAAVLPGMLAGQDPSGFFAQNCASCHTVGGGRLTGPDLKNVEQRKDRAWLVQFMTAPGAMLDRGDPYALRLKEEARGVVMPNINGLTPALAAGLLDLIAAESKLAKSRFAGAQISDRPFTSADVADGRRIFSGQRRLASAGPACIACHSMGGEAALGGGRLGPDLTKVYERLGGRKGLGAWLAAPATPTMQAVFRGRPMSADEILPLLATFEASARTPEQPNDAARTVFLMLGLGGAAIGLLVFDAAWRGRFRGVRRPLVASATRRARQGERWV
jgi:mono/diheme cytochrome c family protein